MRSSYNLEDVNILLKDITGLVEPLPAEIREKKIQSGIHYCEMLPLEYQPSDKYMQAYEFALKEYSKDTADAVAKMAEKIFKLKGESLVIVSLARAGIPIGILAKRYIEKRHGCKVRHYAISIIRDRGIDHNAMRYILERHSAKDIQFVDGWVGKGAIFTELYKELGQYPDIDKSLAVVSDPANLTDLCGTHEDILIPSSCLNAVVTGLISRTFLKSDIIGDKDFHGAAYYSQLENTDLSNEFIDSIECNFDFDIDDYVERKNESGIEIVKNIARIYNVGNINYIKPGIGEATRVLLRRIPWKILINKEYVGAKELEHIIQLAKEKKVDIEICGIDLGGYKVCGIIKQLADV
ncbi:MAG: cysteine protease StiP family protein [Lachnospiraceae bacterium]|nr:cysteine protease StiP family protein [Lachnospiraceae bacterium]